MSLPDQISILGFDDTIAARLTVPPLTTIRQPFREMGQRAVNLALELLEANEQDSSETGAQPAASELFEAKLVLRASTAAPGNA